MTTKDKSLSLLEFFRDHPEYNSVGPQGLALYYHLITESTHSAPYGFWKTTKSWASKIPMDRDDIILAFGFLQDSGLLIRDEQNSIIYLPGSGMTKYSKPSTSNKANLIARKIDEYKNSPIARIAAWEVMAHGISSCPESVPTLDNKLSQIISCSNPTSIDQLIESIDSIINDMLVKLLRFESDEGEVERMLKSSVNKNRTEKLIQTYRGGIFRSIVSMKVSSSDKSSVGTRELLIALAKSFAEVTGRQYAINWSIEGGMARDALKSLSHEEIVGRFSSFMKDDWFKNNGMQDFKRFFNSINRWKSNVSKKGEDDWFRKLLEREKQR